MSTKHSPRKVTLAMMKGKPIATSVPVIHYHASDDELEEIYPGTDEDKKHTAELGGVPVKLLSTPSRGAHESDISECNSDTRSLSIENIPGEGTPPSIDPWKMFSEIKGKIAKTFEEKLSEIKSDKGKQRHSGEESSSVSDLDDAGCAARSEQRLEEKQTNEAAMTVVRQRGNPVRYVGFSGVKTGLKDKVLQDECVESGIEASEFSQDIEADVITRAPNSDVRNIESADISTCKTIPVKQPEFHSAASANRTNLKAMFSRSVKQLILQSAYKSVAALVGIFCIFYVIPVPECLLGFTMGVFATITIYNIAIKFKNILTTLPCGRRASNSSIPVLEIPAVEEHSAVERFQGWLNELPYNYEPSNYHVARTKSVFFRLEGHLLRIMETRSKVPKRAVWDEPKHKLKFIKRRVYDLSGATIELVPLGLTRRRRWSKKYPICITFEKEALISSVVLKGSTNDQCSEAKVKYKSEGEYVEDWTNEEDIRIVDTDSERSIIKGVDVRGNGEERGEEEEEDDDYYDDDDDDDDDDKDNDNDNDDDEEEEDREELRKRERKKEKDEESTVETMGSHQSCNHYIWNNDGVDDEFIQYEDCFLESEGTEEFSEDVTEETRQRKRSTNKNRKKGKGMGNWTKVEKKSNVRKCKQKDEDSEEDEEEEEKEEEEGGGEEAEEERGGGKSDERYESRVNAKERGENEWYTEEVEKKEAEGGGKHQEERDGKRLEKKARANIGIAGNKRCNNEKMKKNERKPRNSSTNESKLFFFARADREKEDWYRRLVSASSRRVKKQDSLLFGIDAAASASRIPSTVQKSGNAESKSLFSVYNPQDTIPELNYNVYMTKFLDSSLRSPTTDRGFPVSSETDFPSLWINCLIARVLFDVRKCPETINLIQDRIQRKLSNIKLPYFMECLLVSEIAIGQGAPVIRNVTKPVINERGLWLDLDIAYKGSLTMTVETKLNLMKLTKTGPVSGHSEKHGETVAEKQELATRSPIFDSDLEDTPETSTEDDCDVPKSQACDTSKETTTSTRSSGRKFRSMVDRIAASKYFQHATELSYVRRAMEGVSNTEIRLMVTVSSVEGCLSVNIPPAPSDRLWYGFKPVPKVSLTVKPAVGERTVNIVYVTKWIEAKLLREFEKLVVLPNMDDLVIPLCPNYP